MSDQIIMTIRGVPIHWDGSRIYFTTGMTIDGDGSPRCYGPNNSGLDYTANAGHPGNWWGVVTDRHGNPVEQIEGDPYPSMWVSTTSYERPEFVPTDPKRYLDSEKIRFMVLPSPIRNLVAPVVLGCKARASKSGRVCEGLCGDFGPSSHAGEGSIATANELGVDSDCRTGGTNEPILWEFWPGVESLPQNGEEFPLIPA